MFEKTARRSILALTLGALAGCAMPPATPPSVEIPRETRPVLPAPVGAQAHFTISQANGTEDSDPLAALNLTAQQRQQLEALEREAPQSDRSAVIQRLLLAPQIDVQALKARMSESEADISRSVEMLVKVRNILTPQQRAQLVQTLNRQPEATSQNGNETQLQEMQKQLSLNAEQTRLFSAMVTARRSHEQAQSRPMREAYASFMTSGDAEAYRQAMLASNRSMPLDAMIAFFSSLTQAQRQKLFGTEAAAPSRSGS
jgi:Spy/CpxP family protein refolding chaperone